jgi:hypothetical protein
MTRIDPTLQDQPDDDEPLPVFRHWVASDYAEDEPREDDRADGIRFFQGLFNALAMVAVIVALIGLWIITP